MRRSSDRARPERHGPSAYYIRASHRDRAPNQSGDSITITDAKGGIAAAATPQSGCADDEDGIDVGGRAGYDWQRGSLVLGALVDISRPDVRDGVSAFSTTPAFYAFDREINRRPPDS